MIYIGMTIVSGPLMAVVARVFHLGDSDVQLGLNLFAALTAMAGAGWGLTSTTSGQVAKDASSIQGVQVHADTTAPPAVVAATKDPNFKDVVPMGGKPVEK
jgi:hypothetical protein